MVEIVASRDFDTFSEKEQIRILCFMYGTINSTYYNSQLPHDTDIRIHILQSSIGARCMRPDPGDSQYRIEFNQSVICEKPFSDHRVWPYYLEDTMAHEMVHLFNRIHDIQDVNSVFKDGRFTVFGYHNKYFKKAAIEHGQSCKRTNGRIGFSDTHLITYFPLESWMME